MSNDSLTKSHWKEAANGGASLGLAIALFSLLAGWLGLYVKAPWAISMFNFAAIAFTVYTFGQRRAERYGDHGFSFGQSMGFILTMMLFTGIVAGIGSVVTLKYVIADYHQQFVQEYIDAVAASYSAKMGGSMPAGWEEMVRWVMNNPFCIMLSTLFNMVVYGAFIGLIASVFIKRPAKPMQHDQDGR